jgi:hypothetical protein
LQRAFILDKYNLEISEEWMKNYMDGKKKPSWGKLVKDFTFQKLIEFGKRVSKDEIYSYWMSIKDELEYTSYANPNYVVFSGNGIHLYYM